MTIVSMSADSFASNVKTLSLRAAITASLCQGGIELLNNPKRLISYVLDLGNRSLTEIRVLFREADEALLRPLVDLAASNTATTAHTASCMAQTLECERHISANIAGNIAFSLTGGVADYLGIPFGEE